MGALRVKAGLAGNLRQHRVIADVGALPEISGKKRLLQLQLPAFNAGPMQQTVGVEGIVDPRALLHVKAEPELRATITNHVLTLRELLRGRSVLVRDML